jgi:tetratricopeptide (TPR) repeat protein
VEALADRRQARITDPSLLPGYDVFNDMRLALALEGSPDAAWFQELTASMEMQPELAEELDDEALAEPLAYVQKKLEMPVVTFTGPGASALNNELLKAEAAMDIGHFHEAVDHYKLAHLIDPINPLPMIGRGHALLAAGDYRSSAFWLLKGLERFPDVARFAFDLRALMGGAEVIDIRRADILDRLEQRENAELRFLLGYLEYHGGQRPRGLENLRRAAADPRASALIARYPKLLEAHAPAPMPEAPPPSAPPHPAATPEIPDEGELVIPPSPPQAYEPE